MPYVWTTGGIHTHMFISCDFVASVWREFCLNEVHKWDGSWCDWLLYLRDRLPELLEATIMVLWRVWIERCNRVFGKGEKDA